MEKLFQFSPPIPFGRPYSMALIFEVLSYGQTPEEVGGPDERLISLADVHGVGLGNPVPESGPPLPPG